MITSNYQVDGDIFSYADKFWCSSSDDKPTNEDAKEGLINGATLEEVDTGKEFVFDKAENKWTEKKSGEGSGGSSTLSGLTDVDITNPSDGQTLVYNATAGKWENGAGKGVMIVTENYNAQTNVHVLDKTWQEIKDAITSGVQVLVKVHSVESDEWSYTESWGLLAAPFVMENTTLEEGEVISVIYSVNFGTYSYDTDTPNGYPLMGGDDPT